MKPKIKDVLNGIVDGSLPAISSSITKKEDGSREVNRARLTASVLSWLIFIAFVRGLIPLDTALEFLRLLFAL
jgi:hypothetical protein